MLHSWVWQRVCIAASEEECAAHRRMTQSGSEGKLDFAVVYCEKGHCEL